MKQEMSVVRPEVREEHKMHIRALLLQTNDAAEPYLESQYPGTHADSFFKDEFVYSPIKKLKARLRRLLAASPFLKRPSEISRELKEEAGKRRERQPGLFLDPLRKALQRPMEENY